MRSGTTRMFGIWHSKARSRRFPLMKVRNPALQEAGQPPLFYAAAAGAAHLLGLELPAPQLSRNPHWGYPSRGTVNDNKNRFVHRPGEWRAPPLRALLVLRLFSLVLGAGAVVSAYGLARAVRASTTVALAAAAFVATVPQYLFIASSVSNDALITALTGAALWALVVALRAERRAGPWLIFGLLAGLASLTKVSGLLLPLLGATMAIIVGIRRRDARIAALGVAVSLGGLLICTGWWYLRNTMLYGDPLGLRIHFAEYGRQEALALGNLVRQARAVETSFWAAFGWGNCNPAGLDLPGVAHGSAGRAPRRSADIVQAGAQRISIRSARPVGHDAVRGRDRCRSGALDAHDRGLVGPVAVSRARSTGCAADIGMVQALAAASRYHRGVPGCAGCDGPRLSCARLPATCAAARCAGSGRHPADPLWTSAMWLACMLSASRHSGLRLGTRST